MEMLNTTDLLDFTLDDSSEEDKAPTSSSLKNGSASSTLTAAAERDGLSPEFEEELEWISNKDAFPSVDTCFDILSENFELIQDGHSPVSVLENSTTSFLSLPWSFPARPRSKNSRRKRKTGFGQLSSQRAWLPLPASVRSTKSRASIGRRCLHCQADKTPQWRTGPMGPKTLCNACGVRYKSGRLVPEYRPVNSPTFSSALHSNSHRKVVEMRRKKYLATVGENGTKAIG